WDSEVQRALAGAIEDLKLLVRSVRTWSAEQDTRVQDSLRRLARYAPAREERREDLIIPISQLFYNDVGPHIVYVATNPKTHYEQQLRENGAGIGPGTLSTEVKRITTPSLEVPLTPVRTPPRGHDTKHNLNQCLP